MRIDALEIWKCDQLEWLAPSRDRLTRGPGSKVAAVSDNLRACPAQVGDRARFGQTMSLEPDDRFGSEDSAGGTAVKSNVRCAVIPEQRPIDGSYVFGS